MFPDWAVLLDDFNRADGSAGDHWSSGIYASSSSLRVIGNRGGMVGGLAEGCWTAGRAGSDVEVYCQVPVLPTGVSRIFHLYARLVNPGTADPTGYALAVNFTLGQVELYRVGGGSMTFLNSVAQTVSAGDWIGLRCEGAIITGHHRSTTGAWQQVVSVTDAMYSDVGYVGVRLYDVDDVGRIDDFSAGPMSVVVPDAAVAIAAVAGGEARMCWPGAVSPSWARLATVAASTMRSPPVDVNGKIGEPLVHLTGLSIVPLLPLDAEVAQVLPLNVPREAKQTFVAGVCDIREGDRLVVGWREYVIRAVAEWPGGEAFLHLVVEEIK